MQCGSCHGTSVGNNQSAGRRLPPGVFVFSGAGREVRRGFYARYCSSIGNADAPFSAAFRRLHDRPHLQLPLVSLRVSPWLEEALLNAHMAPSARHKRHHATEGERTDRAPEKASNTRCGAMRKNGTHRKTARRAEVSSGEQGGWFSPEMKNRLDARLHDGPLPPRSVGYGPADTPPHAATR
jgi:hypothetical protein